MPAAFEIRPLERDGDRTRFSCGQPDLRRFFQHYAKPDAVGFYECYGFVPIEGVCEGTLHGEPTPMFLPAESVAAALAK